MAEEAPTFDVVLRGYDRRQVDAWLGQVRAGRAGPPTFTIRLRGYHPEQVNRYVGRVLGAR